MSTRIRRLHTVDEAAVRGLAGIFPRGGLCSTTVFYKAVGPTP